MVVKTLQDIVFSKKIPDKNGKYEFIVTEEVSVENKNLYPSSKIAVDSTEVKWVKTSNGYRIEVPPTAFEQGKAPVSQKNLDEVLASPCPSVYIYPAFGVV